MKKIAEQTLSGLWTTQWWDIGQNYIALVKIHNEHSTLQVLTKNVAKNNPPHWDQSIDVTKEIVHGMLIHSPYDVHLTTDAVQCQYIQCNDIEPLLLHLEQYLATLQ